MLDTIHAAILEAGGKSLFFTLSKLTSEEVFSIWDTVSEFVEKQLSMNKGVSIPGLGTFSFLRQKLEISANKHILVQRPVFLLSEKLVQIHGLKRKKIHTPGDIPIVKLNFIMLSLEGPFNREIVEGCVRETLLFFSRAIANKQNVEFTFKGIGVLVIRDNKVKMKFFKDFLQAMDGSGNLLKALSNRPGTGDSVLSSREATVPLSRNVVLFPRMEAKEMETITEEEGESGKEKEQSEKENSKKENLSPKRLLCRQALSPAKVTGVSLTEELEKNFGKTPPQRLAAPVSDSKPPEQETSPAQVPAPVPAPVPVPRSRTPSPLCQDHGRAGQEMCYLCMQRAQRNIPVYLNEERRRKEKEEERILAQYQALKDQDSLQKQQQRALASREQNQKIAAFNLGVAEALRSQKNEKAPETYRSYIFEKRPSSANSQKQEAYSQELARQLEEKIEKETKLKQDKDLVERLEQVHLAEELAAQRAKYIQDRVAEMQCYKKALDSQIKIRPAQLPPFEPDSAIFGKNDMSKERMEERRKRSQEYSRHQLQVAADRKRAMILSELLDQRRAEETFQRAKKQWVAEKGARLERIFQMNLAVKEDWAKSADMKRQRDYEEKLFQRAGDKLFLLDQCAKYRRCYQCKRRLSNCGESNEWNENKYIPGSRLMV